MELLRENGIALYIEESAFRKMIATTRKTPFLEAGGVLLGKKHSDWGKYIITDIGVPTNRDIQRPLSFTRNRQAAQEKTDRAWYESHGEVNHLGEWHSHIFPSPNPSLIDKNDMRRAYKDGECLFEHFFTLIVSCDMRIYIGIVEKGTIVYSRIIKVDKECMDIV
jgi:integrative and conjugative element protein (TIGR02256 family)